MKSGFPPFALDAALDAAFAGAAVGACVGVGAGSGGGNTGAVPCVGGGGGCGARGACCRILSSNCGFGGNEGTPGFNDEPGDESIGRPCCLIRGSATMSGRDCSQPMINNTGVGKDHGGGRMRAGGECRRRIPDNYSGNSWNSGDSFFWPLFFSAKLFAAQKTLHPPKPTRKIN